MSAIQAHKNTFAGTQSLQFNNVINNINVNTVRLSNHI